MLKNRHFAEVFDDIGEVFKHVPKFLDVRFRYVIKMAEYMDVNDRPLYLYYTELRDKSRRNEIKLSETEQIILSLY